MKRLLIAGVASILAACGGGGSSSGDGGAGSSDSVTISLDTVGHSATYLKAADGTWSELPKTQSSVEVSKGTNVDLVVRCTSGENEYFYVFYASGESNLTSDYTYNCSDDQPSVGRIEVNNNGSSISIDEFRLTGTTEVSSSGGYAYLSSSSEARTVIATGYDAENEKAYFYKKTGLMLSADDVLSIDFTDTTYSKEVQLKASAQKAGFEFNLDYSLSLVSADMPLMINGKYVEVPEEFRVDGDVYRTNWQFGEDSAYNVFATAPNLENSLTSAPAEITPADLEYSQDGRTATVPVDLSGHGVTESLNFFTVEYDDFGEQDIGDDSLVFYDVDGALQAAGKLTFELINLNDLPDASINLSHPSTDSEVYVNVFYGNAELGKAQLQMSSN